MHCILSRWTRAARLLVVITAFSLSTGSLAGAAVPEPPPEWKIPQLELTALPEAGVDELQFLGTDGTHLYAEREIDGFETHFVRVDRDTGAVAAEYEVRDVPVGTPYDPGTSWTINPDGVVLLDGDRETVAVLDSETLAVRRRVPLPENTRNALPPHSQNAGPVWVGHRTYDFDSFQGRYTRRATTLIDVKKARAVKTLKLPACGSKGGVQPDRATLVLHLECSHQLAVIDVPTGKKRMIPSFQFGADISLIGSTPWFRWNELGYLGRLNPDTGKLKTLDLSAGGPPLRNIYNLIGGDGSVWIRGTPVDDTLPGVLFRIDPATMKVTARAWINGTFTIIGDIGYSWDEDGRLASFDPATVRGAAPKATIRPKVERIRPHQPRNRTERAAIRTFEQVFDFRVSNARVADSLEGAEELEPIRTKLTTLAKTLYKSIDFVITDVTVKGDQAALAYTFTLNGSPAFVPLTGSLTRRDGKWIVSKDSVCQLAITAGIAPEC